MLLMLVAGWLLHKTQVEVAEGAEKDMSLNRVQDYD
jgi:hypothetical protein